MNNKLHIQMCKLAGRCKTSVDRNLAIPPHIVGELSKTITQKPDILEPLENYINGLTEQLKLIKLKAISEVIVTYNTGKHNQKLQDLFSKIFYPENPGKYPSLNSLIELKTAELDKTYNRFIELYDSGSYVNLLDLQTTPHENDLEKMYETLHKYLKEVEKHPSRIK